MVTAIEPAAAVGGLTSGGEWYPLNVTVRIEASFQRERSRRTSRFHPDEEAEVCFTETVS